MIQEQQAPTVASDITLDDLKLLQDTLDAYEVLLDHAKKNWKTMSTEEKMQANIAFVKIVELANGFEV
jgi:hypothetical protein